MANSSSPLSPGIVEGKGLKKKNASQRGVREQKDQTTTVHPYFQSGYLSEYLSGAPQLGSWVMLWLHLAPFVKGSWNDIQVRCEDLFTAFNF